jgi:hypothetical protein
MTAKWALSELLEKAIHELYSKNRFELSPGCNDY